jgi:hypothetical protein
MGYGMWRRMAIHPMHWAFSKGCSLIKECLWGDAIRTCLLSLRFP